MQRRNFLNKTLLGTAGLTLNPFGALAQAQSIRNLKITGVKIHRLRQKLAQPMGYCCAPGGVLGMTATGASVIEVTTDAGLTGWGDGSWGGEVLRNRRDLVIGRSPFEVEAIFDDIRELSSERFRRMPRNSASPGGLDVALWDLVGKALGKPVFELLGHKHHDRVMPYASAGYRKDWKPLEDGFAEELRHWTQDMGFRAVKVKTGYDPVTDVKVLRAVRKAIGDRIHMGIDSGTPGAYDDGTAVGLGRQLEELNLEFWEEPINKYDLDGYRRLKNALRIPLASGEALPIDWVIENYIQTQIVDIAQPDISESGLTGGKRISYACWLNRVRLVPHSWGTPIRIASEMHWVACFPNVSRAWNPPPVLFELHLPNESPAWGLTTKRIEPGPADGKIEVPTGPGLGIEINRDELDKHRTSLITI
ncbi:MAG: mandelate racemase/muconate lactonizing enzyme family protein [bacterium]|nr:mandelate racemase/muconate lactonizing enzyme family protein [bacterium]